MKAKLSTHVLDTMHGKPAAGLHLDLYFLAGETRQHLASFVTNADGRTNEVLLGPEDLQPGIYEIVFQVGAYFEDQALPQPAFLNEVPVRFGLASTTESYHVPLLVSPWSYSTYRGS